MKVRGMTFSSFLVRQMLAGYKTETRRLAWSGSDLLGEKPTLASTIEEGDILYVKEAIDLLDCGNPAGGTDSWCEISYLADGIHAQFSNVKLPKPGAFGNSRFMPRWASRLTLIVDGVEHQSLQRLTQWDARSEGTWEIPEWNGPEAPPIRAINYRDSFAAYWDRINKRSGTRWADNPDVVAISYRVIDCNVDAENYRTCSVG